MGFEAIPKIPAGLNIYLSLVPSGEESWLEINCNGEWLALFYWSKDGQAITDLESGVKAVEYFIRTGEFYPGIAWMHEFVF